MSQLFCINCGTRFETNLSQWGYNFVFCKHSCKVAMQEKCKEVRDCLARPIQIRIAELSPTPEINPYLEKAAKRSDINIDRYRVDYALFGGLEHILEFPIVTIEKNSMQTQREYGKQAVLLALQNAIDPADVPTRRYIHGDDDGKPC